MESYFNSDFFQWSSEHVQGLIPVLFLCLGIALATIGAALRASTKTLKLLSFFVLSVFMYLTYTAIGQEPVLYFGSGFLWNTSTQMIALGVALFALLSTLSFHRSNQHAEEHSEWLAVFLLSTLGMVLISGSRNWVSFFLFLELLSIPAYLLVALDSYREKSLEAAVKYLFMGAFSSALLLMGMALLFVSSASFDYASIHKVIEALNPGSLNAYLILLAALMVFSSLAFKLALVPFHLWSPDVYQGAPSSSAGFLASASKLSVLLASFFAFYQSGFFKLVGFDSALFVVSMITVLLGSFIAIGQLSLKRLLAYSSIINMGYMFLAFSQGNLNSIPALYFYSLIYGLSILAAFVLVQNMLLFSGKNPHGDLMLEDLVSLKQKAPARTLLLFTALFFSFAGIPPFPGFFAKYYLLMDLWSQGALFSVGLILVSTFLGLAYYLRTISAIYFSSQGEALQKVSPKGPVKSFDFQLSSYIGGLAFVLSFYVLLNMRGLLSWAENMATHLR